MDESKRPDIPNSVRPNFAVAERYSGEWVIPKALGRAHLVLTKDSKVHAVCGHHIAEWFSADGRAWDGCETCVAFVLSGGKSGSIHRHSGTWRIRLNRSGRVKCWHVRTREAAEALLAEKLRLLNAGVDIWSERRQGRCSPSLRPQPPEIVRQGSLSEWLDEWLAEMALARPRTINFYREKLAHVRPQLGAKALVELQPRDIRLALSSMASDGVSPTMLHHIHRTLTSALYGAKRERLIGDNPCVDVARPKRADFEATTLTEEQARRLVAAARGTKLGPLVGVALFTGMRQGELLALTWDDIDLEVGQITVNKTVQWSKKAGDVHRPGPTKTRSARRTVRIEGPALTALGEQRQQCDAIRERAPWWVEHNLVFPALQGGYMAPSGAFFREYRTLLARADCPQIRFHDLRHTAGLFLTRSVGVVVASRILGHASPTITMTLYGHAQPQDYAAAAHAMSGMLGGEALSLGGRVRK
jgi:integrase